MTDKQIQDWQEKVRSTFGDQAKLYQYLFETMDNFYYRYLETTLDRNLRTSQLGERKFGARSSETSMVDALKITHGPAKKGIMELAKHVPKARAPKVSYELSAEVLELSADHGSLTFTALVDWNHRDFEQQPTHAKKTVKFDYTDLGQFRKELALKLEEACELFL